MTEFYVPTDVETTGLKPHEGHLLLEIAAHVVQPRAPYAPVSVVPFHRVIRWPRDFAYERANDYVREMHTKTGLWDRLEGGMDVKAVDEQFLAWLQQYVGQREGYLFGNSVRLDANFIDYFLPRSAEWLHYRLIDVTTLGVWSRNEFGVEQFPKVGSHTAEEDIAESIAEAAYIRTAIHEDLARDC